MSIWRSVVTVALCLWISAVSQLSDNTPPIMWLDRNWVLPDNEPIGSIVTKVRAEDSEQDMLTYGLEPVRAPRPGHFYNKDDSSQPLPFFIDNSTGTVFVNDTLKGRGGQNLFLYVTVSDGRLMAKNEVYVNIKNTSAPNRGNTRTPFPSQHDGRIRPPIIGLSNLPSFPSSLPPLLPKQYSETTKLKLEKTKDNDNDTESSTLNSVIDDRVEMNEVEGPALSSKITPSIAPSSQDITMTLVPVAAGCVLVVGLGMGVWSLKNRYCDNRKSKPDTATGVFKLHHIKVLKNANHKISALYLKDK